MSGIATLLGSDAKRAPIPAASRTVRIAAKLGGVVPNIFGIAASMPGCTLFIAAVAAGLSMMSISGEAAENGVSRSGQSVRALAAAGFAINAAQAATARASLFMQILPGEPPLLIFHLSEYSAARMRSINPPSKRKQARPLRIHQTIARDIGIAIVAGAHAPGTGFGGEIEHSEALGVSRTAYREALRILVAKGLLESRPKAGTHVTPRSRWNLLDPEVLAWMFSGKPDRSFIDDLYELRGIVEPAAAGLAAQRRSKDQLAAMRKALGEMREYSLDAEPGLAADQRFHRLILEAAGNETLVTLAGSVAAAVQWSTRFKQRDGTLRRDAIPDHEAVFDAISGRQPKRARSAMAHLLELALKDMDLIAQGSTFEMCIT